MDRFSRSVAVAALFSGAVALAQEPLPMGKEPHHRQLLYTAHVRMFDITVPAGASTLDHSHDRDVVTVALGPTTLRTRQPGEDWSAPRSYVPGSVNVTRYTGGVAVHRMENIGKTPYRVFAVENLREKAWSMPQLIKAAGTTLLQQDRSFAVYEVRLGPSTTRTSHVHQMPTVVILISGSVEVQGGGGESVFRMEANGRWFPSQWDQPHTLTVVGESPAHLVEVEAR